MAKEYDVKDVNIYITDVMRMKPLDRVRLWLVLQNTTSDMGDLLRMRERFQLRGLAVQANILYRFGPIVDKVVRAQAEIKAAEARKAGEM